MPPGLGAAVGQRRREARALWLVTSDRTLPSLGGAGCGPCRRGSVVACPLLGPGSGALPAPPAPPASVFCQDTSILLMVSGAAAQSCTSGRLTARRTRSCSWHGLVRWWAQLAVLTASPSSSPSRPTGTAASCPSPRRTSTSECPAVAPLRVGPRGPRACPLERVALERVPRRVALERVPSRVCSVRARLRVGPGLVALSVPCACVSFRVCVCPCERHVCALTVVPWLMLQGPCAPAPSL